MASYDKELLATALRLLRRRTGQRGKLAGARIRRSISTSYYALFHFLLGEAGNRLIGTSNELMRRRRILVRAFTHAGIRTALDKVRGVNVDQTVADFLRQPGGAAGLVSCPTFAQIMARAFSDAQAKRHDADYDLIAQRTRRKTAKIARARSMPGARLADPRTKISNTLFAC